MFNIPYNQSLQYLEENLWSLWSNFGQGENCNLFDDNETYIYFDTPIKHLPYNTVLRFADEENSVDKIDRIINHYQNLNVPFLWLVHPSSKPDNIEEILKERGLQFIEPLTGMILDDFDALPETGEISSEFKIKKVSTEEDLKMTFEMLVWRWKMPEDVIPHYYGMNKAFQIATPDTNVHIWAAIKDNEVVSKVVLNLDKGCAGIYGVSTKPEARGKGLARHLTLLALQYAREQNYTISVLHSTPMAERIYAKLGYKTVDEFRIYASEIVEI